MSAQNKPHPIKAILVGLQLPKVSENEVLESLKELERLTNTMGASVIYKMTQKRSSEKTASVLGDPRHDGPPTLPSCYS